MSQPHHGPPTSLRKAYRANWPVDQRFPRAAESYLELKGFSCNGLIDQLSSDYADKFTKAQARYGAEKAGVC